ncbi:tetratricopeptide repeat protein [Streptomyces sp. NPDC059002]|uniref:tetratricopeptide repeat protein n=1 Tax=Streptomyces sp. NPDC059002 TaxID=3346690 RepID=UPI00369D897D
MLPQEAHCFQDRGEGRRLAREMAGGGTAVLGQVLAGTGGVGKTQLAARYARDLLHHQEIDLLLWITAVKRKAVVDAYAQAAEEVLGIVHADSEQAAAQFLAWLQPRGPGADGERGPGWMVVLDDLADPVDLLADPAVPHIGLWPPAGPHGRTLVTTRRRDAVLTGHGHNCIDVGLFAREESVAYLTQVLAGARRGPGCAAPREDDHDACVALLAGDLGDLPLALSQAAAYLLETDLSCAEYRALLSGRTRALDRLVPDRGMLPDTQSVSVAATWSLSLDRADRMRPRGLASPMFELIALLDPSGIPAAVLTGEAARSYLAGHRRLLDEEPGTAGAAAAGSVHSPVDGRGSAVGSVVGPADGSVGDSVDEEDAVDALRALHRMHLIDYTPGVPHQAVRVHQLVQRSIRESLKRDRLEEAADLAADALVLAWPEVERDTALSGALRANADALRRVAEPVLWGERAHNVLFVTGSSLTAAGRYGDAKDHFQALAEQAAERLGPDHRDTLEARLHLADLWAMTGHPGESLVGLLAVLDDYERTCGPDDIATLRARHEVAHSRGLIGNVSGALADFERLLVDLQREVGDDQPETLSARGFLALWWGEAGDTAGAIAALEQLVADRERVLGRDHPEPFRARHNLARYRGQAGDAPGAVAAYEELLADRERVLGPDHTETLGTRGELAYWLRESGDGRASLLTLETLMVDVDRVLGPDHIEALAMRRNLAYGWQYVGDEAGAVLAYRQQYDDLRRLFGPHHTETASGAAYLAAALIRRGRQFLHESRERAREDGARSDHRRPPTPDAERRTAMPDETSQPRPAWFEQALACFHEARDLTNPEDSPGVYGVILHDIADTYRDARDLKEAVEHFRQAVSYKRRADNPSDLATTMTALANTLVSMGEPVEARDVLERLVALASSITDVERRGAVLHNVGLTYEELGNLGIEGAYEESVAAYRTVLTLIDGEADPGWYATVLKDIGDAYEAQDLLEEAHSSYEDAVRYTRRIEGTPTSLITVLIALGRISRRLGKLEGESLVNGGAGVVNGVRIEDARAGTPPADADAPVDSVPPSAPQDGRAQPDAPSDGIPPLPDTPPRGEES